MHKRRTQAIMFGLQGFIADGRERAFHFVRALHFIIQEDDVVKIKKITACVAAITIVFSGTTGMIGNMPAFSEISAQAISVDSGVTQEQIDASKWKK